MHTETRAQHLSVFPCKQHHATWEQKQQKCTELVLAFEIPSRDGFTFHCFTFCDTRLYRLSSVLLVQYKDLTAMRACCLGGRGRLQAQRNTSPYLKPTAYLLPCALTARCFHQVDFLCLCVCVCELQQVSTTYSVYITRCVHSSLTVRAALKAFIGYQMKNPQAAADMLILTHDGINVRRHTNTHFASSLPKRCVHTALLQRQCTVPSIHLLSLTVQPLEVNGCWSCSWLTMATRPML